MALTVVACTESAEPAPVLPETAGGDAPPVASPTLGSLDVSWRRSFDGQSALHLFGGTLYESGWQGISQYELATGREIARLPRSDDSFHAWIGVDEAHDPVLIDLGTFMLGRDQRNLLARFEVGEAAPRWVSPPCGRLYAATPSHHGGEVTLYCAAPNDASGGPGPGELVRIDPATGTELGVRASFLASGPFDTHALLEVGEVMVVRAGDHLLGVDRAMQVLFQRTMPNSFGLAPTGTGILVVESGVGLVELDPATGANLRVLAAPQLVGSADAFTSRLGELTVTDGTAYVECAGTLHTIDLDDGRTLFRREARGAVLDEGSVYACSGNRFVELDRATGDTRSSYSTGGCTVIGVHDGVVLVRYGAPTLVIAGDERSHAGVLAFERRGGPPPPCVEATITGHVTINGIVAPGITVRAGEAWVTEASGVTHFWGAGTTPVADGSAIEAVTGADGSYRLTMCDRGHVPVIVDPEGARAFAHEVEADGILGYLLFDGASEHTLDFAVSAHGPSL